MLPLFLSRLQKAAWNLENNIEPMGSVDETRKLHDKGMVGLCFVALSSECSKVREVSLSSLQMVQAIIENPVARKMQAWRDRPQLTMILRSVRKAMGLRFREQSIGEGDTLIVPKLPPLSAVFLGHASIILSRPGDPLFGVVNRCFLQEEEDGGAFAYMGRLPMFVALFCSSALDLLQLNEERQFALKLIKDGIKNEDCYKFLTACHAPELLLTSVHTRPEMEEHESERETILLIETLGRIMNAGGHKAVNHLVLNLGVASWLRSLLPSWSKSSLRVRCVVLNFSLDVVKASASVLTTDQFCLAFKGVGSRLVGLCIGDVSLIPAPKRPSTKQVCSVVSILATKIYSFGECEDLDAQSATSFLSDQSDKSDLIDATACICWFRLHPKNDDDARSLVQLLLQGASTSKDLDVWDGVLRQIRHFSEVILREHQLVHAVLDAMLVGRSTCFGSTHLEEKWWDCVREIVSSGSNDELVALCHTAAQRVSRQREQTKVIEGKQRRT